MNILGIDYGEKYIGLALADDILKIASPYKMVKNTNSLISELKNIIQSRKIKTIVVGLPFDLENQETEQTRVTNDFINELKKIFTIPIKSFDERLTTKLANKLSQDNKERHSIAASIILQNYLDKP